MGIKRSILNNDILGHTNPKRSKIPDSFNSSGYHRISNALCNLDRHGQYTDMHIVFVHLLHKIVRMENGNAIQASAHQSRIHVKCSDNLSTKMLQTRILQQSSPKTTDSKQECFVNIRKTKELF